VPIRLTRGERQVLQARVARARAEQRDVLRARIVLAAAAGVPNVQIAARLGVTEDTVRKWRGRFATDRLDGLNDLPRSGRPKVFAPVVVAQVKAIACSLPAEQGLPLSAWTCAEIAQEAIERGVAPTISASTVGRILARDVIKPWQCRSWIFPRDPDFGAKAGRVLDLYARRWNGRRLGGDDYVISADEKSQLQALRRLHPDLPPGPGQPRRQEFEYQRGGTLAYFAALDVHLGKVIGRCAPKTGIEPFGELVAQVMNIEPYASARRVYWVVDNGSSHNGARSTKRMSQAFPNATLIHLPVHASWIKPGRDLLLHRAAQGRQAPRLPRPDDPRAAATRLSRSLQPDRRTLRLALQPQGPQRLPRPPRCPREPGGMTPDELTEVTTSPGVSVDPFAKVG